MRRTFISASLIFLAGCTSTEVLMADEYTIVVQAGLKTPVEAQVAANQKCESVGKVAKLDNLVPANSVWGTYFFSCLEKND